MMRLQNEKNVGEMLKADLAVLYIFVDWSEYARRGVEVAETAEMRFTQGTSGGRASWWIGDFSSIESPIASVIYEWLTTQEQAQADHLFPIIALGHGSIVWMRRGKVVSFAASAIRLGVEGVLRRTEGISG